jgi:hypothetical protein
MVPWLTEILNPKPILTLNQVSRRKNRRTGFENLPSTVSSLSMLPQNLPVSFEIVQMPKMGGYFDVKTRGWLISKIIQAPGVRGVKFKTK